MKCRSCSPTSRLQADFYSLSSQGRQFIARCGWLLNCVSILAANVLGCADQPLKVATRADQVARHDPTTETVEEISRAPLIQPSEVGQTKHDAHGSALPDSFSQAGENDVDIAIAALEEMGVQLAREDYGDRSPVLEVSLFGFRSHADAALAHAAKVQTVRKIDLSLSDVTDRGLVRLHGAKGLEVLKLGSTKISDDGLARLGGLKRLKVVDLSNTRITDIGLRYLHKAPLEKLNLYASRVSGDGWGELHCATTIRALNVRLTEIDDRRTGELATLTNLRELEIGDQITDAGVANLTALERLEKLVVFGALTDRGLAVIGNMTTLKDLRLGGGMRFTDAGVGHLKRLSSLEELWLAFSPVTDEGIVQLRQLQNLQRLYLTATDVGDAGVSHLSTLQALEILDLQSTKVSDECILDLAKLKNLERLHIESTNVTEAGIVQLQKDLPDCFIGH